MAVEPFFWYCRPVANGIWAEEMDSAFGAYTPCAIDSLVICISHLVLLGLCFYRMLLLRKSKKARKYNLRTNAYNYFLALLAGLCTAEPIIRLTRNISIFDLHGQSEQAPFEMVSLIIEAFAWGSMLLMIGLETKIYVREFRWYVRFGVVYVLVGEAAMLNIILSVRDRYSRLAWYMYVSAVICQVLFGILLLAYIPNLDPYPGFIMMEPELPNNDEYEALPGGEKICPERHVNLLSRLYFGWMTPIMQEGYKKPITEKDVWKLDTWDQTETLIKRNVGLKNLKGQSLGCYEH